MIQSSDNIEPSTMNYVFDMFGKSVSQMLQASINQQTMIDELRSQIRAVQAQVNNVTNTLEEFEDRIFVKVQEMRPVIYTRDGIPFDDALDLITQKLNAISDKSQEHTETMERFNNELKNKLDQDTFETSSRDTQHAVESVSELNLGFMSVQKEQARQRQELDEIHEKVMKTVSLKLEQFQLQKSMDESLNVEDDGFVKLSEFKREIANLKKNINGFGFGFELPEGYVPTGNPAEDQFNLLQLQQQQLEAAYQAQKRKITANMETLLAATEEEDEDLWDSDDFIVESEIEPPSDDSTIGHELQYRSIAMGADGESYEEETFTAIKLKSGARRSIGLAARTEPKTGRRAILEAIKKGEEEAVKSSRQMVDEARLQAAITSSVLGKVENMLVDFFSMQGIGGVKLDRADAKALVTQLSSLQGIKEDTAKLKLLIALKMDATRCTEELDLRLLKDDFFAFMNTCFPNNSLVQRATANFRSGLPPLSNSPRSHTSVTRSKTAAEPRRREKTTTNTPNLVPARNSRLLALNQKFLRGADGRYYLRDMGDSGLVQAPSITGNGSNVGAEAAFDFQPFTPARTITKSSGGDFGGPSAKHRSQTPPDNVD